MPMLPRSAAGGLLESDRMRFWTALQAPLFQAALVDDGKIVETVPPRPPSTPARRVYLVGEYDSNLIIGRRNSLELWSRDGTEFKRQVYHPWIYSLHDCEQYGDNLILACATLDVVFELTWDGDAVWSWWAWKDGLAGKPDFIDSDDWQTMQLTQEIQHDTAHLNSIQIDLMGRQIYATLLRRQTVVSIPLPHIEALTTMAAETRVDPHDYQRIDGRPVYGFCEGLQFGPIDTGRTVLGYDYPKRIRRVGDTLLVTHEGGVSRLTLDGDHIETWPLPRPFGFACIE